MRHRDTEFVRELAAATGARPCSIRRSIKRMAQHGAILPVERPDGKVEWVPNFGLVQAAA